MLYGGVAGVDGAMFYLGKNWHPGAGAASRPGDPATATLGAAAAPVRRQGDYVYVRAEPAVNARTRGIPKT